MQNEFEDPLAGQVKERDYQSTDGCNFPPEQEVKSLNEGSSNKNYVFNNCNVTINEEGKAIGILQDQEKRKAETQKLQMKIVSDMGSVIGVAITELMQSKAKSMSENTGEPVMKDPMKPTRKRASAKKKAPVKKVVKKK